MLKTAYHWNNTILFATILCGIFFHTLSLYSAQPNYSGFSPLPRVWGSRPPQDLPLPLPTKPTHKEKNAALERLLSQADQLPIDPILEISTPPSEKKEFLPDLPVFSQIMHDLPTNIQFDTENELVMDDTNKTETKLFLKQYHPEQCNPQQRIYLDQWSLSFLQQTHAQRKYSKTVLKDSFLILKTEVESSAVYHKIDYITQHNPSWLDEKKINCQSLGEPVKAITLSDSTYSNGFVLAIDCNEIITLHIDDKMSYLLQCTSEQIECIRTSECYLTVTIFGESKYHVTHIAHHGEVKKLVAQKDFIDPTSLKKENGVAPHVEPTETEKEEYRQIKKALGLAHNTQSNPIPSDTQAPAEKINPYTPFHKRAFFIAASICTALALGSAIYLYFFAMHMPTITDTQE
jgi:hypothetical protein